jgi:hypothetical protein
MTARVFPQLRNCVWTFAVLLLAAGTALPARGQVTAKALRAAPVALTAETDKAASQDGPIRGPLLGYVYDPASLGLRPLPGIPGASYVGTPLPLGFTPEFVEVSPGHDYALGVEAGTRDVFEIDLRPATPAAERLAFLSAGVDRIFFSPLGKAAALYYRQAKQVVIVTGLPDGSPSQGRVDLAAVSGMLTAVAISDDGKALAAASSEGDRGALFVGAPGEDLRLVGPLGTAAALSFLNDSQDLLAADAGRSEVVRVRNIIAGAEWTILASRQDGLDQPVAVAASRDNTTAFAVSSADRRIARISLVGGAVEFLDCPCTPTGLNALASGAGFRLTSASSAPIYMLDAHPQGDGISSQPRVLFIPAPDGAPADAAEPAQTPRGRVRR